MGSVAAAATQSGSPAESVSRPAWARARAVSAAVSGWGRASAVSGLRLGDGYARGRGVEPLLALRDLDDRLRGVPQPDGSQMDELRRRRRLALCRWGGRRDAAGASAQPGS